MKKKRLLFAAFAVVMFAVIFSVTAFGAQQQSGNYKYTVLNDDTVKITAYLGKETTVNIPSEIDGKTVTALGFGLFSSSSGTHTVVVPDSVVSLDGTIQMSNVKNLYLGAGVEKIRSSEFYGVKNLSISEDNPNFACVDGVLYDKTMKSLICVPTGKEFGVFEIPEGVEKICDGAIVEVKMNSLIIPNTVTHIGREAISYVNGITSLVIPSSVESMSMYAIYQCNNLRTLKFENGNLKQIGAHVVEECEKLYAISIPANVESVPKFYSCTSLSQFIVSSANKKYAAVDGVLYNKDMTKLISYPAAKTTEEYRLSDSVTVICDGAFYNVKRNLKTLYLHKGVTEFEYDAFMRADGFEIYYEGSESEFDAIENADTVKELVSSIKYNNYVYRPVTGIKVSVTDTTAAISWDKVPYATGYRVFRKTATGWKALKTTTSTSYTADGLSDSTEYTFAVKSYRKIDGETLWAPEYSTVEATTALGVTSSLTSTPATNYITLKWNAVEGAGGYRVFVKNNTTGKWDIAVRTTGKKTTATVENLEPGKKYTFAVRAYLNNGSIVWAPKYKSINTVTKPGVTDKVTSTSTENSVTLNWNKVPGATGYRIYVVKDGKWKALKTTTGLTYTATGLTAGTKYTFAVKAYTKLSGTAYWASKYAKFVTATKTEAPSVTKVTAYTGKARVYWSDVNGETGYQVYYSTKESSGYKKFGNFKANTENGYVSGLTSGKTYYFKVRTYTKTDSGYVYSAWSNVKSIKVK